MTKPTFIRKHFFINRNMQISYMVTFLVPMLVMLIFMLLTLYLASETIISTSSKFMRREVVNVIDEGTQDRPELSASEYENIVEQIRFRMRGLEDISEVRREFAGTLMWVFGAGILLVVLQISMMTIFFSHKFAGPVYRFEKACQSVIDGNYNDVIRLRKGDQMLNLANLLNEAMKLSGERIETLENKVKALEGNG